MSEVLVIADERLARYGFGAGHPFGTDRQGAFRREFQDRGLRVVGTSDDAPQTLYDLDLTGPVALVLGAEGTGLRQLTRKTCDELVQIPMQGAVESLNVSVASAVCLYEALRQRRAAAATAD